MPVFRAKATCAYCHAVVRQPKEGEPDRCESCGAPSPWAPSPEHERHRQSLAQRAADHEHQRREAELRRWQQLRSAAALTPTTSAGFVAQKGEEVYLDEPVQLAEWKKERGHYQGGTGIRGVSVRVPGTKTMRAYYGGLNPRQYVPGAEGWTVVDAGHGVVTNKRIVFRGTTKNIEWAFSKLVGLDVDEDTNAVVLQVSNRQRAHVLMVGDLGRFLITVEAALARFRGDAPLVVPPPLGSTPQEQAAGGVVAPPLPPPP